MGNFVELTNEEMVNVDGGGKKIDTFCTAIGLAATFAGVVPAVAASAPLLGGCVVVSASAALYSYAVNYAPYRAPSNYKITKHR